jgi:hypothetical protein
MKGRTYLNLKSTGDPGGGKSDDDKDTDKDRKDKGKDSEDNEPDFPSGYFLDICGEAREGA